MSINIAERNAYIRSQAQKKGLDPESVAAIEHHEGGSGGIGDNNTSFGPFQMHEGGALPSQAGTGSHAQAWAWSDAGINAALNDMVKAGAKGLTGRAAVTAISTKFERPSDPAAEIADAMSVYGKNINGGGTVRGFAGGGKNSGVASGPGGLHVDTATYRAQAAAVMQQQAMSTVSGKPNVDPTSGQPLPDLATQLAALKSANTISTTAAGAHAATAAGGDSVVNISGGGSTGSKAAAMALRQVGAPYVWGGENAKGSKGGAGAGFDCSGLVQWAYGALGIKLPRLAADQGKVGSKVSYTGAGGNLKPGDLLTESNGDHIVMYIGNGKVVQAPHTGTNVQISPLSWFPPGQYNASRIAG